MKIEFTRDYYNNLWLSHAEDVKIRYRDINSQVKAMSRTDHLNNEIRTKDGSTIAQNL